MDCHTQDELDNRQPVVKREQICCDIMEVRLQGSCVSAGGTQPHCILHSPPKCKICDVLLVESNCRLSIDSRGTLARGPREH
ncbi:hypothetical protein SKAU_G00140760 [Synaphobranchus kaupii]|uniref:Uncharacterized protein n=1 Tax=Synaphobranchus kaupii TaxID=118154 RepID=A0A9Q1FS70_SYNKA|nr:hypothetical protein SKAU_G00140760 [Synaphobranchus kaupii]